MTDIVERLRERHQTINHEAADTIIALRTEVEALRGALRLFVYDTTHLSAMNDDGSHWACISACTLDEARAALKGGDHG